MNGRAAIRAFITILIVAIVGMILYWAVGELSAMWHFPAIIVNALYTILVVAGVIIVIDALLAIVGRDAIHPWRSRRSARNVHRLGVRRETVGAMQ